jgi:hypothetical protein
MKNIIVPILVGLILFPVLAIAESDNGYFTLLGGLNTPAGKFGDDEGSEAGLAKAGFCLGFEYSYPMKVENLEWVVNPNFLFNGLDEDQFQDLAQFFNVDLEIGNWINIPMLTGLKYRVPISSSLDAYGTGLLGLSLAKAPTVKASLRSISEEIEFEWATSLAFGVGGGLIINDKFNIGLRYMGLGKPEIKPTSVNEYYTDYEQPIAMVLIWLGVNL